MSDKPFEERKHTVRDSAGGLVEIGKYTRGKAIKLMCTECMGHKASDVKDCQSPNCPLFPFRGPSRAAYASDEEINKVYVEEVEVESDE